MKSECAALGLMALFLGGCGESPEGFVWEVTLTGAFDECNTPGVSYQETFDYVIDLYSPPTVTVALDSEVFATGAISGCDIDYTSVIWTEERDNAEIRWQLSGTARFRLGDSTCSLPDGLDWVGSETFEIVDSYHPDIDEGCRYILDSEGTYQGELD